MRRRTTRVKTRAQEAWALAQRAANRRAGREGRPLPYPSIWESLDQTKVPPDATAEEIQASYEAFREWCPPPPRKEHII